MMASLSLGPRQDILLFNTNKAFQECHARLEIVDAWKIGNGKNRPVRYGFVGKIKIPKDVSKKTIAKNILIKFQKFSIG